MVQFWASIFSASSKGQFLPSEIYHSPLNSLRRQDTYGEYHPQLSEPLIALVINRLQLVKQGRMVDAPQATGNRFDRAG